METRHQYVIVGSGLAGVSAAEGIRERDRSGSILLLGRELDVPYDRPPLTKQLWFGKKKLEDVFLHPRDWYASNGIELLSGCLAEAIELDGKVVVDHKGNRHRYEKLLLATGGEPRRLSIPGGDLEGVCYYRTLEDYRRTQDRAKAGRTAVVVGGGFIGSELAAALAHAGAAVTMIFPDAYLGFRVFPEGLGRSLQQLFHTRGIEALSGDVPASIERKGDRFLVTTRSGAKVACDLVIVGIGIRPSIELAQAAGLAVGDGVIVDERLRSSAPDVYVAGDNAFFPYAALGRSMRVEHWDNALTQGKHAGRNMAGAGEPYLHLPFFFSDLFEFGYEAVGEVSSRLEIFTDWQEENRKGVIYYLADGRVRGAMMCDVWDKVESAREMIRAGARVSPASLRGAIR
jgi:NADPH-dependent 2,4-dienoyl-CoA reductase/sulfur reductase-like enzyme